MMPGRNMSNEAILLLKLLEDGGWHSYEQIVSRVALTVAPGRALRKWEALRDSQVRKYGPRQSPEPSDDEKIASGQRTYAVGAVNSLKERHLELRGDGAGREMRRRLAPLVVDKHGTPVAVCGVPEHHDLESRMQEAVAAAQHAVRPAADEPEGPQEPRGPAVEDPQTPGGTSDVGPQACESCGFYVANWEQHKEFHVVFDEFVANRPEALPAPREMGLVDEPALRALVRQEVEAALDAFQQGMQGWLLERFAALEEVLGERLPTREQRGRINRRH